MPVEIGILLSTSEWMRSLSSSQLPGSIEVLETAAYGTGTTFATRSASGHPGQQLVHVVLALEGDVLDELEVVPSDRRNGAAGADYRGSWEGV